MNLIENRKILKFFYMYSRFFKQKFAGAGLLAASEKSVSHQIQSSETNDGSAGQQLQANVQITTRNYKSVW